MNEVPLIQIYRCLCDKNRLRIVHLLKQGPLCVCHFQTVLNCRRSRFPSIWLTCANTAWPSRTGTNNG